MMVSLLHAAAGPRQIFLRRSLLAVCAALCLSGAMMPLGAALPPGAAMPPVPQTRGPVQRTVSGQVTDKGGAAIGGAVVYLEDQRTSAVKSAIADDKGNFRFVQLTQNTDYLLWAKKDGKKSPNKTISSFDSKNDFVLNLKIAD